MTATVASVPSEVPFIQRPLKGSRISSFYPVKELPPLSALDSAFQLQEYISLLIRKDVHDVEAIVSIPGKGKERDGSDGDDQKEGGEGKEVTVDEACWIYEQLRRLAQDLSHPLITMLQQECTRQTCPEMKAGEWLYLCVAHGTEGAMEQCCAIDYILHTLDSATALLNSPRAFPSRLSIPAPSHRHFSSLARRLGRIFAHAYFHHRAAFAQAEAESALYARFLALTSRFDLVPPEFLVIPAGVVGYAVDEVEHTQAPDPTEDYPRLHAASIDLQRERERGREDEPQSRGELLRLDAFGGAATLGSVGEGEKRDPSPRKFGRSRTDTMVHSEVASVVEELGRAGLSSAGSLGDETPSHAFTENTIQDVATQGAETTIEQENEPVDETSTLVPEEKADAVEADATDAPLVVESAVEVEAEARPIDTTPSEPFTQPEDPSDSNTESKTPAEASTTDAVESVDLHESEEAASAGVDEEIALSDEIEEHEATEGTPSDAATEPATRELEESASTTAQERAQEVPVGARLAEEAGVDEPAAVLAESQESELEHTEDAASEEPQPQEERIDIPTVQAPESVLVSDIAQVEEPFLRSREAEEPLDIAPGGMVEEDISAQPPTEVQEADVTDATPTEEENVPFDSKDVSAESS